MQCFIYKSLGINEIYLYLDSRDDFSRVPEALLQSLGRLVFVMELELSPERKLARADAAKVKDNIQRKGFYVQMPPMPIAAPLTKQNNKLH